MGSGQTGEGEAGGGQTDRQRDKGGVSVARRRKTSQGLKR